MTSRVSQSASRLYAFNTSPPIRTTLYIARSFSYLPCQNDRNSINQLQLSQKNCYSISSKITDKLNPEAMDAVKQTVAQNMGIPGAHTAVPEDQQFDLKDTPDLKGKVAVITGGSDGIGYACTHTLLSKGLDKVFIISISKEVIDESTKTIEKELGEDVAKKITWLECDLADWKATKKTADKIAKSTDRIDILINNAARGIMTYQLTDYGVDRHVRFGFFLPQNNADISIDGYEPHVPRHPHLPSPTHLEENRLSQQYRTYCQYGLQRAPSHALRYQIRISRRTQPGLGP